LGTTTLSLTPHPLFPPKISPDFRQSHEWSWSELGVQTHGPPPSYAPDTARLRKTVYTHCASVHQPAKLVAALLRVARVTAGLAESNGPLDPPPSYVPEDVYGIYDIVDTRLHADAERHRRDPVVVTSASTRQRCERLMDRLHQQDLQRWLLSPAFI